MCAGTAPAQTRSKLARKPSTAAPPAAWRDTGKLPASASDQPPRRRPRPGQGQRPRVPPPPSPSRRPDEPRRSRPWLCLVTMATTPPGPRPMTTTAPSCSKPPASANTTAALRDLVSCGQLCIGRGGSVRPRRRRRDGGGEAGPGRLQWCSLIHTETWAGSRAFATTLARSSRTASRSTASFRRAANAATVWSASYRARLNRRSTARWTRRRSGLNSAATAGVEAATATGDLIACTWVARRAPSATGSNPPADHHVTNRDCSTGQL